MKSATLGKATAWSAVDLGGRQLLAFAVSVVLARLLTPADYGAVALLMFFTAMGTVALQAVVVTALIQRADSSHEEQSAAFWWTLTASVLLGVAFVLIGPVLARFYGIAVLAPLMTAAAAQLVFQALGSVQSARLTRLMRFDVMAKLGLASTLISGLVAIALALAGGTVWALAAQLVTVAALTNLSLWWADRWRPGWHWSPRYLQGLLRFSGWLSLSSVLEVIYTQGFALWLGKLFGVHDLGLYNRASSLQQLPGTTLAAIISRVSLPWLSSHQDQPEELRQGLLAASRLVMLVNVPLLAAMAIDADLIMRVLFGPQWDRAALPLAILAGAGLIYPLQVLNLQVMLATGRTKAFFRVEIAKKCFGVASIIIGSYFGLLGLAFSQLIFSVVALILNVRAMSQALPGTGLRRQVGDLLGIFAAAGVMVAAMALVRFMFELGPFAELLATSLVGSLVYLAACIMGRVRALSELRDRIGPSLPKPLRQLAWSRLKL